jgi:hypothetical protein
MFDAVGWPTDNQPFTLGGQPLQMTDLAVPRKTL